MRRSQNGVSIEIVFARPIDWNKSWPVCRVQGSPLRRSRQSFLEMLVSIGSDARTNERRGGL